MKPIRVLVAGFVISLMALAAVAGPSIVRLERHGSGDRAFLLAEGVPLVEELEHAFLAYGNSGEIGDRLMALGYRFEVLDHDTEGWVYALAGLRPGWREAGLPSCARVIWTEENWVLIKVPEGIDLSCLESTHWILRTLSLKTLAPPVPPPAKYASLAEGRALLVTPDPLVQAMVDGLSNAQIQSHWTDVVTGTTTRYSTSAGCQTAAENIYNKFLAQGLAAAYQNHTANHAPNVIGTIQGQVDPGKVYIAIGHLDDMPSSGAAPGADDNASGSAMLPALSEVMSCYGYAYTVKFIAVTGEEFGLYGSEHYADQAAAQGEQIQAVLNADMTGWEGDGLPGSGENLDLNYDSNSEWLGLLFESAAADYGTGCVVDAFLCPSLSASDHYPFWQNGFSAVCGITDNEGYCSHSGHYPYYHTSNDTLANCGDPSFYYATVRAYAATLAHLAEPFKIAFDRSAYACGGNAEVILADPDLNTGSSTAQTFVVEVWSDTETTPESLTLTEQGIDSMIFRGTLIFSSAPPVHGDGVLSVAAGDAVSAGYVDSVDCNGAVNVNYEATASMDCTAPALSTVQVTGVTDGRATVTWTTDEASNSRVDYGTDTNLGSSVQDLQTYGTSHSITLTGLDPCTPYYFSVTSVDVAGNTATADNGGGYYTFVTLGRAFTFGPDDVESGPGSWSTSGQWHISTCRAHSQGHSWKIGAVACPGEYNSSANSYLTSPNIDLGAGGYVLRWSEWYDIEYHSSCGYDSAQPQISTNGGGNWTNLGTKYCDSSGGWIEREVALTGYTGTVKIRFWFESDSGVEGEGWYVDDIDVSLPEICELTCSASVPPEGNTNQAVQFQATATSPGGGITYAWVFGDGGSSGQQSPTHVYTAPAYYDWTLTVTSGGDTCFRQGTILITDPVNPCSLDCFATAAPPTGSAPLEVHFSAAATPLDCQGAVSYTWTFGDGGTSNLQSPLHLYSNVGSYPWTMTAEVDGVLCQRTGTVWVGTPPPCAVTCTAWTDVQSGTAPLAVNFKAQFSAPNCSGDPVQYWDFGDGSTSFVSDPSHVYSTPGSYTWTFLVAVDGITCSRSGRINVSAPPCSLVCAAAAAPSLGDAPLTVSFTGSATHSYCGGPLSTLWDFGDGTTSTLASPLKTYATPGTYGWTFTAEVEGVTCVREGTVTVTAPCEATCSASANPGTGTVPLLVSFGADVQTSNCSGPAKYHWDFGDGGSSTDPGPQHLYTAAGAFTWNLSVEVDGTVCTQTGTVTVAEPCTVICTAAADPAQGTAPLAVAYSASADPAHCGGFPTFTWNFGDGWTSTEQNPEHTYASAGTFGWMLIVAVDGITCTRTGTVTVNPSSRLPGDANMDGIVTIGELQLVVNMFLGLMPAGNGADCDGSGTISIGELQLVVNAFLGEDVSC